MKKEKQQKPPKEKRRGKKEKSTNEFINLADVRGAFLYTKDQTVYQYIKVQPISTALMTREEKELATLRMSRELSPISVPFKILFLTRSSDVRQIVEYYEGVKATTADSKKRESLTKTIRWISSQSTSGQVLERQTFIVLWANGDKAEDTLAGKAIEFRNALAASGVTCSICDQTDITNMLGLFYNPAFTVGTPIDYTNKTTLLDE